MATQMGSDWPVSSYQQLKDIQVQLQQVCQGATPLARTLRKKGRRRFWTRARRRRYWPRFAKSHFGRFPNTANLEEESEEDGVEREEGRQEYRQEGSFACPAPQQCALDVASYQKANPGVKYANLAEKTVARTAVDALKEVLKSAGMIALKGSIAFAFIGNILNNFFPSAGGLPSNPCTYATSDWGKCVWQQIMPFVQSFVAQQFDQAFEELWTANIKGYQLRLWALNATAYLNSAHYPNGTVRSMPNSTLDRMYTDLAAVHNAMIGDINLFMTGYAVNTTAGAYLARFATLHVGLMNNLLSYPTYRTAGDRYVFQIITTCYAQSVYQAATQAFKARMATFRRDLKTSYAQCGGLEPALCALWSGNFQDTWTGCSWAFSASAITCVSGSCIPPSDPQTPIDAQACYNQHQAWVENQTVSAWTNWLALLPWWLSNVLVMQNVSVQSGDFLSWSNFAREAAPIPDIITYNTSMSVCERAGEWQAASHLFGEVAQESLQADVITYSAAVGACERSSNWQQALEYLTGLESASLQADAVLYGAAVSACARAGNWEVALGLLKDVDGKRLSSDVIIFNAAISACERGSAWREASNLLATAEEHQVKPDVISYNATICAYEKSGHWEKALALLMALEDAGLQPDAISFNSSISACETVSAWQQALLIWLDVGARRLEPTVVTLSTAISACEKAAEWRPALTLLDEAEAVLLRPNVVAYNSAISACEKSEQWRRGLLLLKEMRSRRVEADAISYNSAISACEKAAEWQQALQLLADAQGHQIRSDVITFNAAISACGKREQWRLGLRLLEETEKVRLKADVITYTAAMGACEKAAEWQHALALLEDMGQRSVQPNVVTYNSAISACEKAAQWEQALFLLGVVEAMQHLRP
ncbi:unnamed protein product [Symbiodinium natans]|uniref:Pentatricopeptide repeat-containing protein, chloroplastic n=1 Tax=Symbiodinium natans TaxID=878477 RepID=A0A812UEX6_9DINO|nr:unnamed protein product [Symbiodinium natans]